MTKAQMKKHVRKAILALQQVFLEESDTANPGEDEEQVDVEEPAPPRSDSKQKKGVYPGTKLTGETEKAVFVRVPGTSEDESVPLSMLTDECRETRPRPGGTWTLAMKPGTLAIQRIEDMLAGKKRRR